MGPRVDMSNELQAMLTVGPEAHLENGWRGRTVAHDVSW